MDHFCGKRVLFILILGRMMIPGIMNFTAVCNDYIWPLVTVPDKAIQTFSAGVTQFGAAANLEQGPTMAGFVIGSSPLVIAFAFGIKYYIHGLTQGAVKG